MIRYRNRFRKEKQEEVSALGDSLPIFATPYGCEMFLYLESYTHTHSLSLLQQKITQRKTTTRDRLATGLAGLI